jgi:hypothetical protein
LIGSLIDEGGLSDRLAVADVAEELGIPISSDMVHSAAIKERVSVLAKTLADDTKSMFQQFLETALAGGGTAAANATALGKSRAFSKGRPADSGIRLDSFQTGKRPPSSV